MFRNALYAELDYNEKLICPKLKNLLKLMLNKDPKKRITKGQTHKIKEHPWCADIDWRAIYERKAKPPHIPSVMDSNFDPEYVRETSVMSVDGKGLPKKHGRQRCINVMNQSTTSIHSYFYQDHDLSGISDMIACTNSSQINDISLASGANQSKMS